jgi:hypothetical protein
MEAEEAVEMEVPEGVEVEPKLIHLLHFFNLF